MAESTSVSRRYASALISLAAEQRATERIASDLGRFAKLLQNEELKNALCTPLFGVSDRTPVLEAILARLALHPLATHFLQLVNEKGRFSEIESIIDAFERLADESAGRERVEVATAEPMSPHIEAELRSTLERALGKHVVLTATVDPSLLGGMVAKIGSKVYDSSIRTRLEQITQTLIHAQLPAQA